MPTVPRATVVVVARDRWAQAPTLLDALLARTDPRHDVVVVEAGAPASVSAALDRRTGSARVRIVRRRAFLAANAARNLGADGARTEWIAFVENDAVLDHGWLEALLAVGEERAATSVYPAYLVPDRHGAVIHGLGADLEVGSRRGVDYIREHQHQLGRRWDEVAGNTEPVARVQSEFHAVAVRREFVERIGGLDEGLLSWFDHTDLALHHLRLGAEAWLVPSMRCLYLAPPPVAARDLPSFVLRWSREWYQHSLTRLCATWNLDPDDTEWERHAHYRTAVRRSVLTRSAWLNARIDRAAEPLEHLALRWNERLASSDCAAMRATAP